MFADEQGGRAWPDTTIRNTSVGVKLKTTTAALVGGRGEFWDDSWNFDVSWGPALCQLPAYADITAIY